MRRRWIALSLPVLAAVTALGALPAGAQPRRSGGADAFLSLNGAAVRAHWRQSRLSGVLLLQGTDDERLALTLTLTRGSGRWSLPAVSAGPGDFEARVSPLPRTLVPGAYRLLVDATSSGAALPEQQLDVAIKAPREGVVDSAWISGADGRRLTVVSGSARRLYWHFHFATWPAGRLRLGVTLFGPHTKVSWIPTAHRPNVVAGLPARAHVRLRRGSWRLVLSAGGRKATGTPRPALVGGTPVATVHFTVV